ncbi:MAG TPA: zf-HC2 domain-containing protein [Pyrinomonadaceae bacterium]|jgi:hypothetical protein|nr:zf-HC2 domain-containing protein [Pyrinomonadaceae bacterium]
MTDINKCERAEELVSYVYDEASTPARQSFEQHLSACVSCRTELAGFGEVRGAVRAWHAQVLADAPALSLAAALPESARNGQPASTRAASTPRRSAWAALREFFMLTPMWARAGMVAAALCVCTLAALAVVNAEFHWDDKGIAFNTGFSKPANAPQPAPPAPTVTDARFTQADMNKAADERAAAERELAAERARLDAAEQQVAVLNASLTNLRAQHQTTLASLRTMRGNQANARQRSNAFGTLVANNEPDDEGLRLADLLNEVSAGREQPPVKRNNR